MAEPEVTGWINCRTPPLADRPGIYEVRFGQRLATIRRVHWDGKDWAYPYISHTFSDAWRGLAQPAEVA